MGRMAEPAEIVAAIEALLGARRGPLAGRRVLVTAGGTREPLDAVRFLGNRSSGRMGAALADEARARGAEVVTLLAQRARASDQSALWSRLRLPTSSSARRSRARDWADVVLMAAAVADYRPADRRRGKRERERRLVARARADRRRARGDRRSAAARDRCSSASLPSTATDSSAREAKRQRKGVDLIVLNDVSRSRHRLRRRRQRGRARLSRRRGARRAKAQARDRRPRVLDRVERLLA